MKTKTFSRITDGYIDKCFGFCFTISTQKRRLGKQSFHKFKGKLLLLLFRFKLISIVMDFETC